MNSPPMSANSFSSESTLSSESSSLTNSDSAGTDVDWVVIGQGPRTPAWYFPRVASPPPAPTGVVRWQGPINVREDAPDDVTPRTSWIWKNKWLALTETALALHIWEPSPQQAVVQLSDVVVVARSDLTPYCFLLETRDGVRRYFSFKHEEEMREWLDDISTRSPEAAKAFTFVRDRPSEATPAVTQSPPQAPSGT
ncbi:hypothetical protein C8R46DRAFT_363895 [Mycena filopes]|nr:hypothetical protein C8R46DRAFT_363895 [Mycena filopes]